MLPLNVDENKIRNIWAHSEYVTHNVRGLAGQAAKQSPVDAAFMEKAGAYAPKYKHEGIFSWPHS